MSRKHSNLQFVSYLMSSDRNILRELMESIWDKQNSLLGSPNFTYKGELYLTVKNEKIYPLHKSLYSNMKEFLAYLKQTEETTDKLNKYFLSIKDNVYHHIPASLSKQYNLIVNEENIVYHPIFELIQEKLLMKLIGD